MHELPITERILSVVLRHAEGRTSPESSASTLRVGELSDLADEWIQRYFSYLSRGTLGRARGACDHARADRAPVY